MQKLILQHLRTKILPKDPVLAFTKRFNKGSTSSATISCRTLITTTGRRTRHTVRSTRDLPTTTSRLTYRPYRLYTPYSHYPVYSAKTKISTPVTTTNYLFTCATFGAVFNTPSTSTPTTVVPVIYNTSQMEVEYSTTMTANTTEQIFSTLRTVVVTEPYVDVPLVVTLGDFY
jgi:hypothetical protein